MSDARAGVVDASYRLHEMTSRASRRRYFLIFAGKHGVDVYAYASVPIEAATRSTLIQAICIIRFESNAPMRFKKTRRFRPALSAQDDGRRQNYWQPHADAAAVRVDGMRRYFGRIDYATLVIGCRRTEAVELDS